MCATLLEEEMKDSRVLDLCCGHGRILQMYPIKFYVGVDYSQGMLDRAEALNKGKTCYRFQKNNGKDLSGLREDYFDIVVCNTAILHMPCSIFIGYVKEVHRVLSKGGKFIFNVPKSDYDVPTLKRILSSFATATELEPKGLFEGFAKYDIIMLAIK